MPDDPKTIPELIQEAAAEPSRARDKAIEVQNRSLTELIEADKHQRKIQAAPNPFGALKRRQVRPGRPGGLP